MRNCPTIEPVLIFFSAAALKDGLRPGQFVWGNHMTPLGAGWFPTILKKCRDQWPVNGYEQLLEVRFEYGGLDYAGQQHTGRRNGGVKSKTL